jgi:acylphosphatase
MTETGAIVRHILVGGAVQGVGYREFAHRAALRLGVTGWVRNCSDGAVEALIWGRPTAVDAQIAEMRRGPRSAVVNKLSLTEHNEGDHSDFGVTFVIRATT